ncbi:MAG TPA: type II secretion system protein [Verrucomicrobiae bacterium]|jgi:prepilin-type N-terminal cleavage/methylation domain-containing protein
MTSQRAFTLVELLVVIAIIGILAALLFPALIAARLQAQQVQCSSNVRQLSLSVFIYTDDNSGTHVDYNDSAFPGGGNWSGTLTGYYSKNPNLRLCPAAPLHEPVKTSHGNGQGYADRAWARWTSDNKTMFYGSFGYNGWLYSGIPKPLAFAKASAIQQPSQTPVFSDENWVDGWPMETDPPARNLYQGRSLWNWGEDLGRWTIARHGGRAASNAPQNVPAGQKMPGAIDMGLADGHAESVKLENLWQLNWHLNWQTPSPRPQ